jgi:replicative DNA helicase
MNLRTRSEEIIIKEILSNPGGIHDIMEKVDYNMFIDPTTKLIFESITDLYLNHNPINITSINDSIKKNKSIYSKEAIVEMSKIISIPIGPNEVTSCIDLLVSEAIRNEHVELSNKLSLISKQDDYDPVKVINILQDHLVNNKYKAFLNKKSYDNETLLNELEEKMKIAADSNGVSGIRTGFHKFDEITSGMQPTNLIIVAARPGAGKTQFGLSIMKAASIRSNKKGLFISCEMDEVQVMKRLIAVDSGVQGYSIKKGRLMPNERGRFERSKRRISASGVRIVGGSFTITDVITMVHKMKYAEGLDYVVVDYIQKITSPGAQNRTNEVGDVSRKLKDMANELKIPIVALAQLSRAVELRTDKRPILSDLRESGDIEQDADIVSFLFRPSYYLPGNERDTSPIAKQGFVYIAKHRDGELADIELEFDSEIPAWQNIGDTGDYDEDVVQTSIERFDSNNDFDF